MDKTGLFEQLESGNKVYPFNSDPKYNSGLVSKIISELYEDLKFNPMNNERNIVIHTGEFGMHEFNFSVLSTSMGIKGSYLKTSNNYGGHILDGTNKVYFRWRANNVQYFIAKASNNKILSIHKNITKALEWHKDYYKLKIRK